MGKSHDKRLGLKPGEFVVSTITDKRPVYKVTAVKERVWTIEEVKMHPSTLEGMAGVRYGDLVSLLEYRYMDGKYVAIKSKRTLDEGWLVRLDEYMGAERDRFSALMDLLEE